MTKERMSGALSPNYQAPVIKVVSFKVERGFDVSNKSIVGSGTETPTEGFEYQDLNTRSTGNGWSNGQYF